MQALDEWRTRTQAAVADKDAALAQYDTLTASLATLHDECEKLRATVKQYEDADTKPYTLGQTGSPVGDSPGPTNAAGGGHVEDIQAPRNVAESQLDSGGAPASSPCLPQSSEDAPGWVCPFCGPVPGKQVTYVEEHENCGGNVYASDDSAPWFLRELSTLRARAEKEERELRLLRDEALEEIASADRGIAEREEMITRRDNEIAVLTSELARFQRANVPGKVGTFLTRLDKWTPKEDADDASACLWCGAAFVIDDPDNDTACSPICSTCELPALR